MLPYSTANRIQIATADEVAARLPSRKDGAGYRTRGYCHGSGDKPTSASLVFSDPPRPGEQSLHVHCYKCNPSTPAERDPIRHALQKATGLLLCLCPECRVAHRTDRPPGGTTTAPRRPTAKTERPIPTDTSDTAAKLWQQAQPSTGVAPHHHPVNKWLTERAIHWPAGQPLPETVRWLPRSAMPRGQPHSPAAGALIMAMRALSDPAGPTRKVHLIAIDAEGRKAYHWQADKRGDKHTFGKNASVYGLLWKQRLPGEQAHDLHVCEGLADGLALLTALPDDQIIAVCAGARYNHIEPGWFASVTLWPDGDQAGLAAARNAAQPWIEQGYPITIKRLPEGHDPASINWRTR